MNKVKTKFYSRDEDSGINWLVTTPGTHIRELLRTQFAHVEIRSMYDCTGRYFARRPFVRRVGNRVLITQSWGYDI